MKENKKEGTKFKYPKLILLLFTFVIAYVIFRFANLAPINNFLSSIGYLGSFITGLLFSYGFSAGPATALFLVLAKQQDIVLASFIGAVGAVIGDYVIFRLIRVSFKDEIKDFEKEKMMRKVENIGNKLPIKMKHFLIIIFAEMIIGSPLPDELGVAILSLDTKISKKIFVVLSFAFHFIGILVIMLIGRVI